MSSKYYEYIIIGPASVGKTSIMLRYTENTFLNKIINLIPLISSSSRKKNTQ